MITETICDTCGKVCERRMAGRGVMVACGCYPYEQQGQPTGPVTDSPTASAEERGS